MITIKSLLKEHSTLEQLEIQRRADLLWPVNPALKDQNNCPLHYWWRGSFYGGILTEAEVATLTGGMQSVSKSQSDLQGFKK